MAIELNRVYSVNLGSVVASALDTARTVKRQELAKKEAQFQTAVAEGTMSWDAQIKYREEQLAEEMKSSMPDSDFIENIKASIGTAKKLKRFEGIRTRYQESLTSYIEGKGSLQSYIDLLTDQINEEVDPTIRQELTDELSKARGEKAAVEKAAIANRATLAEKDGSIKLIDTSISEVKDRQANALLQGREDEAAAWGQTLLALNMAKVKNKTQDAVNDFNYRAAREGLKAKDKLDFYNEQVEGADADTPFTLNDLRYPSERAYWEGERGKYIGSTFFDELKGELDAETARISSQAAFGQIPVQRVQAVSDIYASLRARPEFVPYLDKLEQERVANLTTMVDDLSEKLTIEANETGDFNKAISAITGIESRFGVSASRSPFPGEAAVGRTSANIVNTELPGVTSTQKQLVSDARIYELSRSLSQQAGGRMIEPDQFVGKNFLAEARQGATEEQLIAGIQNELRKTNPTATFAPPAPVNQPSPQPAATPAPSQPPATPAAPAPVATPVVNTPAPAAPSPYNKAGTNLNQFYGGKLPSLNERRKMYAQYGLGTEQEYGGTTEQNTKLLSKLKEVL